MNSLITVLIVAFPSSSTLAHLESSPKIFTSLQIPVVANVISSGNSVNRLDLVSEISDQDSDDQTSTVPPAWQN
jgi:hypothetical protein